MLAAVVTFQNGICACMGEWRPSCSGSLKLESKGSTSQVDVALQLKDLQAGKCSRLPPLGWEVTMQACGAEVERCEVWP